MWVLQGEITSDRVRCRKSLYTKRSRGFTVTREVVVSLVPGGLGTAQAGLEPRRQGGEGAPRAVDAMKVRFNIELEPPLHKEVKDFAAKRDITMSRLFREAWALFKLVWEHTQGGGKVVLRAKDGSEETIRFL